MCVCVCAYIYTYIHAHMFRMICVLGSLQTTGGGMLRFNPNLYSDGVILPVS